MSDNKYPFFPQAISDFLYEEEANISRRKIITVGTLLALATILLSTEVFARHTSHSSHRSHSSHSSHSSGTHSSHGSHSNHASHSNHSNHASHESHESHYSHISGQGYTTHMSSAIGHSAHASHGSATVSHTSHASAAPAHSNAGIAVESVGVDRSIPTDAPEGVIDIRVPLTPPDSPSMGGES